MPIPISASRGCARPIFTLHSSLRPSSLRTAKVPQWLRPSSAQPCGRSFTTTGIRSAFAKPNPTTPIKPSPPSPAKTVQTPLLSFAQKLADKPSPTTLYEAAPHRVFLFSSYTAGAFFVGCAAINIILNVYNQPEGLHWIVSVGFGTMGILLAAAGTRFALMPAGMIRSIKVLPAKSVKTSDSAAAKAAARANLPVRLQIEARRSVPFPGVPLRRIQVDPSDVVMKAPLYNRKAPLSEYEKMQLKKQEEARRKQEREYEMNHLMTAPFRHAKQAFGLLFRNFRRGLTGEGFAPIYVNGTKYKLDITSAYVLEEGRALDRIVKIEK
ncbi:uncharacterized protein F4812DRAFT_460089 [Daldinia caldariorum]|uniref:uncharacterized protein n=1 Tax=Daldinia caldariorum TaxID=326644 RepID=UPI0020073F2C|nr:uncharacterized protein F4812DRAFT_460089 [Daldinia caldariorum]KAI1467242.1 hypothetical protein F4812DRAFT_460089 [Daldinia caldariorum]